MADEEDKKKQVPEFRGELSGKERKVLGQLNTYYRNGIFTYLRYRLDGDPHLAEELTQETIFRICWKVDKIPLGVEMQYWAIGFARKVLQEHRHYNQRFRATDPEVFEESLPDVPVSADDPELLLKEREIEAFIRDHAGLLPERQRTFFMDVYDGWTPREISARYGLADQTVHNHIYRAKRFMKQLVIKYFLNDETRL